MDCARIDLIGYHFGTHDDAEAALVERHLVECTSCLESYLTLKRHMDRAARAERPSDAARARLRREVAATFPRPLGQRVRAWLERPIPLYTGLAAATVALFIAALGPTMAERATGRSRLALQERDRVDTSRQVAQSVTIY